jgi:5-methylcytosine-specific restriction protein A
MATLKLRTIGHKLRPSTRIKVALPAKQVESFYTSPEWRALMDAIIAQRFGDRAHARCEDPLCKQPNRRGIRVFGDHVVERKDGGDDLDPRNVLCRCGSCHTRKTAEQRAIRLQG